MVESLKELNEICQKPDYKKVGNWMVRNVLREAALPVTWLLLHTRVTANQVTMASVVIAVSGIMAFALRSHRFFLLGCLLLQVWYYLDHVDGQIARYRHSASLTGRFIDFMSHHLIHGILFFGLGLYAFHVTHNIFLVIMGFVTSVCVIMFNLSYDAKYKTFFEKLQGAKHVEILREEETWDMPKADIRRMQARKIFSFLHKLCEIHVTMNILTAAAFLQVFSKTTWDYRMILFWAYSVIIPVVTVIKLSYLIHTFGIDREFERTIRTREI